MFINNSALLAASFALHLKIFLHQELWTNFLHQLRDTILKVTYKIKNRIVTLFFLTLR